MRRITIPGLLFRVHRWKVEINLQADWIKNFLLNSHIWFLIFIIGLIYTAMIPPLQSPDEQAHLQRAYLLSKGTITFVTLQGIGSGGYIDTGLIEFSNLYLDLPFNRRKKVDSNLIESAQSLRWTRTEEFVTVFSSSSFPLIYLPGAIAMFFGRVLDLSIHNSYFLVRLFMMIASLAILALAISIHPPNFLALFILILPMSLFQFVTVNSDGISYALSLLIISLAVRGFDRGAVYKSWMFIVLVISLFVLLASKWQFAPLALLLFFLGWIRREKKYLLAFVFVVLGLLVWVYYVLSFYVDPRIVRETSAQNVLLYYFSHPQEVMRIAWNTLTSERLLKFYRHSFIGALGWLDTRFHPGYYDLASLFLVGVSICTVSIGEIKKDFKLRVAFLLISLGVVFLIFFAMLVNWSPFPTSVVKGIQGRYLTVPLLFFSYVLSGAKPRYSSVRLVSAYLLFYAFLAISSFLMTRLLLVRYLIQ